MALKKENIAPEDLLEECKTSSDDISSDSFAAFSAQLRTGKVSTSRDDHERVFCAKIVQWKLF